MSLYKGQIPYYICVEINSVRRIWDTYFQFSCDTLQGTSDFILNAIGNKSRAAKVGSLLLRVHAGEIAIMFPDKGVKERPDKKLSISLPPFPDMVVPNLEFFFDSIIFLESL